VNLVKGLAIGFVAALIIGGAGFAYALKQQNEWRKQREEAALNLKKEDVSLTIVEGKRREEVAELLEKKNICTAAEFLVASQGKEGYLFPDTYRFFPNTPATEVVKALVDNFSKKVEPTPTSEQLILASIVEREARNNSERAAIAGVYSNRLRIGMKLDADPTTQYAKDTLAYLPGQSFSFWGSITQADYRNVISNYNTYLKAGLPPGPIANPGVESIKAAMSPAEHDYLYFLHKGNELLFSKTLAEHVSKQ
jgi:UPF0755 protein